MTKKKKVIGVAGLAAVALVGGTFAYFSQSTTIDNPFDTAKYGTIVTEDFNPEDGEKWEPGVEVNKDVFVENTGDRDVVVRVKLKDIWERGENRFEIDNENVYKGTWTDQDENNRQPGDTLEGEKVIASNGDWGNPWPAAPDRTVVDKNIIGFGTDWVYGNDGYFYYTSKLAPGATQVKFLDSVTLNKNTDMGQFGTTYYFTIGKTEEGKPAFNNPNVKWIKVQVPPTEGNPTTSSWTAQNVQGLYDLTGEENKSYISGLSGTAVITEKETVKNEQGEDVEKEIYKLAKGYSIYTAAVTEPEEDKLGYSGAKYTLQIVVETVQATDEAVKTIFGENVPADVIKKWDLTPEKWATPSVADTSTTTP